MAKQTKRYLPDQVEETKKFLMGLPAPKKADFSAAELIEELAPVIKAKLKEGHSLQSIAEGLATSGIEITFSRFRAVWGKLNPSGRKRTKKTEEKPEHPETPA